MQKPHTKTPTPLFRAPTLLSIIIKYIQVLAVTILTILFHNRGEAFAHSGPTSYDVVLTWDAIPSDEIIGYRVYYGVVSGAYTEIVQVGTQPTATLSGLQAGVTYFFAVTAIDFNGLESEYSDEINFTPGLQRVRIDARPNGEIVLTLQGLAGRRYDIEATLDFDTWSVIGTVTVGEQGTAEFSDPEAARFPSRFYRTCSQP